MLRPNYTKTKSSSCYCVPAEVSKNDAFHRILYVHSTNQNPSIIQILFRLVHFTYNQTVTSKHLSFCCRPSIFITQNPPFLTPHLQSFIHPHLKVHALSCPLLFIGIKIPKRCNLYYCEYKLNCEMKRYRNRGIWEFEHGLNMVAAAAYRNGGRNGSDFLNFGVNGGKVVLGIDGDTASTVCICMPLIPFAQPLPDPLPVLARAVAGSSNHNSVGESAARETLEQVMADALAKSSSTRYSVQAVCLSASGVDHPKDQHRLLDWLREIFPSHVRLYVQNDAVAALASGTMGKLHGCVLIAGTGTIAYGFTEDGREARAAGAGPVLGDWGSGYGIAAQALTAVIRAHDGRGPQTTLTHIILDTLNLSSPDELIGWTYADPSWARIAVLLPVVVSCAEAGDPIANKILFDAVRELASSVKAVVERLELSGEDGNDPFPLVMVGGVLEANERWDIGNEVISCISKDFPGVLPIRPKVEPAVGAALLAWNSLMRQCNQVEDLVN